jgi:hypothetical protein
MSGGNHKKQDLEKIFQFEKSVLWFLRVVRVCGCLALINIIYLINDVHGPKEVPNQCYFSDVFRGMLNIG